MNNQDKGDLGEEYVKTYLRLDGYNILEDTRNGCDIVASKAEQTITVEVKTTSNMQGGIPDMHDTEFLREDGQWLFVADYLYVVRLDSNNIPFAMDILLKEEIDRYAENHQAITRIRTRKLDRDLNKGLVGTTIKLGLEDQKEHENLQG